MVETCSSASSTVVWGVGSAKNNSKNKNRNFEEIFFSIFFLQGEKENFEEYSLILEYDELSFPILNNYSAEKCQPYPRAMVYIENFIFGKY
jgi:hypothetical protein